MSARLEQLAAELVAMVPALAADCSLNSQTVIINKLKELTAPKDEALKQAFDDLKDAASGYAPYPWNHEGNPYCETLAKLTAALDWPPFEIIPEESRKSDKEECTCQLCHQPLATT